MKEEEKKGTYCSKPDGDCYTCSLVNYGRDCHNNPILGNDILAIPPEGIAGLKRGQIMDIHARAKLHPGEIYED
ncbi:hypothetical protein [Methanosarcina virus MetMV]|jgi:hypothetical protein|nr:hypothetical protein [Methanosarcina virus MetMV]AZF89988.1 hypothetical protein [Methanosarcina virus MetMV]